MDKILDTGLSVLPPGLKSEVREGCLILVLFIFWDGEIGLCPLPSVAAVSCGSVHGASLIRVCLHSENGKQTGRPMSEGPRRRTFARCGWKLGPAYRRRWETGCQAEWMRAGEESLETERPASH